MKRRLDKQRASAFRAMKFMRANRNEVGVELLNIRKRFFAEPLYRVGVKQNAVFPANSSQFSHWLKRSDFVIRRHQGHEHGVRADGVAQILRRNQSFAIDRQNRDFETIAFGEIFHGMQNRVMFNGRSDDMSASRLEHPG